MAGRATFSTDDTHMFLDCPDCTVHIEAVLMMPVSREQMQAAGQAHDLFHWLTTQCGACGQRAFKNLGTGYECQACGYRP